MKFVLSVLCLLLVLCVSDAQVRKATPAATPSSDSPLTPLSEVERALDLPSILLNQPDFVADEVFFYGEGFGGFSAKSRVARKGNRYFVDTGYVKVITEAGKAIRLNDTSKTFEETPIGNQLVLGNGRPINPHELASQKGIRFVALGSQTIEGHKCLKIEAKLEGQDAQVFLYAAKDLKFLIIAVQVLNPPRGATQRLQNISLEVPNQLVQIPPEYRPLPKHKWTRIDSAQVSYDGKRKKDYSVFRSEDGNQLFVTLYEPHPASGLPLLWHYLVYLKEQTVEIGFQGLLMTKNGQLAWDTSEKEASSSGDNKPDEGSYPCKGRKCPKTLVGTNFVQFPSVYYEDRKSIVRVTW